MPRTGYDFGKLENVFASMIASNTFPNKTILNDLKKELNSFFMEAQCLDVIFTRNTDHLFFGMQVLPIFDMNTSIDILMTTKPVTIKKYCIEIDSKLLQIGLTKEELTAVTLHEVGHIVIGDRSTKDVRAAIDTYFMNKDTLITLKNSAQYTQLLTFAIKDIIRKTSSFIYMNNDEVKADTFVVMCGYGDHLISALDKITSNVYGLSKSIKETKITSLAWIIQVYSDVKLNRIPAIKVLQSAKNATGSELEKREINAVIGALNKIDTDNLQESARAYPLYEAGKKGLANTIKSNGYKALENDYYEFKIRVNSCNDEKDMLYTLRQINSRLTLIYDIIEETVDEKERDRWYELYEMYTALRIELSKKKFPKHRWGLWYDYDALDPIQQAQSMYS